MGKSKELKDYDDKQYKELLTFEEKFEEFKKELYKDRELGEIPLKEVRSIKKELKQFINKEHPERGYFIKYNNFIMDIRKPSFGLFILFVVFSIIGFIWSLTLIF